jgi:hypothetical protein
MSDQALAMYTADDEEWVIAATAEQARDLYCAHMGFEVATDDPDEADVGTHVDHWTRLPDEKRLSLRDECQEAHAKDAPCAVGCKDGIIRTELTCAEWCAKNGAGYHGSASY